MTLANEPTALIESIYDAGLDARLWPKVQREIAGRIGATRVSLWVGAPGDQRSPGDWNGVEPPFVRSYEDYYGRLDPIVAAASTWAPGTIMTDQMMVSKAMLDRSEFFQDWVRPQGVHGIAVANFLREGDVVGLLGAPRACSNPFRQQHLDLLAMLLPHLRHAVRTQRCLKDINVREHAESDALSALVHAILIVDKDMHVIITNHKAETMLAAADGIRAVQHGLVAQTASSTNVLRALVTRATCNDTHLGARGAMLVYRPPPAGPLQVLVSPLGTRIDPSGVQVHRRMAMLLIIDSEHAHRGLEAQLSALFGLTLTEARVANEIGKGHCPKDVADALCVTLSTVRTHLHHVFEKTDMHRQAELMRLIAQISIVRSD